MSRIPGLVEIVELKPAEVAGVPSQVEALHLWKLVSRDLARVDDLFSASSQRLTLLKIWQHKGMIDSARVDWLAERHDILWDWFKRIREMVLEVGELNSPDLIDGAGI